MIYPTYELENESKGSGYKYIVGVDEAGRGGLAFCVVAAAVHVPENAIDKLSGKVNDSKKLSTKRREELFDLITETCNCGVQDVDVETIEKINILEATKLAMKSAIEQIEYFDYALVDGTVNLDKHIWCPYRQVIKGDALSISIAAASILAKVTRDRMVMKIHEEYPIYKFNKNMTYGTKEHMELIKLYGPCIYHRQTFSGVKEYI